MPCSSDVQRQHEVLKLSKHSDTECKNTCCFTERYFQFCHHWQHSVNGQKRLSPKKYHEDTSRNYEIQKHLINVTSVLWSQYLYLILMSWKVTTYGSHNRIACLWEIAVHFHKIWDLTGAAQLMFLTVCMFVFIQCFSAGDNHVVIACFYIEHTLNSVKSLYTGASGMWWRQSCWSVSFTCLLVCDF